MSDPITLGAICLSGLTGPIGNWADRGAIAGIRKLAEVLAGTQTPKNHDVLKATHDAWVESIRVMAQLCDGATQGLDDQESHRALMKATRSEAFSVFRFQGDNLPLDRLNILIEAIYKASPDPAGAVTDVVIASMKASWAG